MVTAPGTVHFEFKTRDRGGLSSSVAGFDLEFVNNRPPDCSLAAPGIATIWPPNGRMVPVSISGVTDPDGDALSITIQGIAQDEPTNTRGDGNTSQDGDYAAGGSVAFVRAERAGTPQAPGDGRVYRISFQASDATASCSGDVFVGVPHDQHRVVATPGGVWHNSLTGAPIQ